MTLDMLNAAVLRRNDVTTVFAEIDFLLRNYSYLSLYYFVPWKFSIDIWHIFNFDKSEVIIHEKWHDVDTIDSLPGMEMLCLVSQVGLTEHFLQVYLYICWVMG